jgi:hypothetical protein
MKKVTQENIPVANELPFDFVDEELSLDGWGDVDFYCAKDGILVLLEVEKNQKHPNTNVVKLWPFLEEYRKNKVLLIQVIRNDNKIPKNRLNLCDFIGNKLEQLFPNQFRYYKYFWPSDIEYHKRKILKKFNDLKEINFAYSDETYK